MDLKRTGRMVEVGRRGGFVFSSDCRFAVPSLIEATLQRSCGGSTQGLMCGWVFEMKKIILKMPCTMIVWLNDEPFGCDTVFQTVTP